jgi:dihydroxyacid dehydratase/phosphogluconate dehydratase
MKNKGFSKGLGLLPVPAQGLHQGRGLHRRALDRPVIGIADTGSGYNPCHGNMPQLIEAVQRGIMLAGGLPVKFPTISSARASRRRPACTCAT